MAERYCSIFRPNLTELAGGLTLVLQGKKTGRDKAGEPLPTHGTLGLPLCPTSLWQRECGLRIQMVGAPCPPETRSIWQEPPGQKQLLSLSCGVSPASDTTPLSPPSTPRPPGSPSQINPILPSGTGTVKG